MAGGPLAGVRVLEFASIGPGPFCAMLMADLGAHVVRIERPDGVGGSGPNAVLQRGRPSLVLDLKQADDQNCARAAAEKADVLIEGLRPGVMERLGLGPNTLCASNRRLIYARMTGYGQAGARAGDAGHDINYLAVSGVLDLITLPGQTPRAPLNLLGDFGGGGVYLAFGIVAALLERERSGVGQVVDGAIVDGVASLAGMIIGGIATKSLSATKQENILAGVAPFYRCYRCADDRYIAVGAIEPQFYAVFMQAMGLKHELAHPQRNPEHWPRIIALLEAAFSVRDRQAWLSLLQPLDCCVSPVLTLDEARQDEHVRERGTYVEHAGTSQPAPAPRFSRTPGAIRTGLGDGRDALERWGLSERVAARP